jgi:hypothetical protein
VLRRCLIGVLGLTVLPAARQAPTFRTGADYVRVDVYPTRDGAPVDDLVRSEFQILEDGVPQQIDAFEHISVARNRRAPRVPDPSTVGDQQAALEHGRARVFVVYLDVDRVSSLGAETVRRPFIAALDRLIGPDDLVALMTSGLSARDLSFSRRPDSIARLLESNRE